MEFPITNIVRNVPRLPNSSANDWGGQSNWTHSYWPQPAHSHRQHSPTRAKLKGSSCSSAILSSTRGMPFRAQLKECTCLTPIPSSTQGICSKLNSRNPAILPLRHHQKPGRSPYKVQCLGLTAAKSPSVAWQKFIRKHPERSQTLSRLAV